MGRQSIWEYFRPVYACYRQAARETKRKILDDFCANTKYNRKYARRLLNGPPPGRARPHRARPPRRGLIYDRRLRPYKVAAQRHVYGGTRPGRLLKHYIPLRVNCWDA